MHIISVQKILFLSLFVLASICMIDGAFAYESPSFLTLLEGHDSSTTFSGPFGIVVDSSDNVYVAEFYAHQIQKFDSNGNFLLKWGSQGTGDGEFTNPGGMSFDSFNDSIKFLAENGLL